MARKLRLEFPGAINHVINRGNYRQFVFRALGTLHAFVIMGNHYHSAYRLVFDGH